jgi:hypothetical protein
VCFYRRLEKSKATLANSGHFLHSRGVASGRIWRGGHVLLFVAILCGRTFLESLATIFGRRDALPVPDPLSTFLLSKLRRVGEGAFHFAVEGDAFTSAPITPPMC